MDERTHGKADSAHPIETIPEPSIKVTRENLDYALSILQEVLDEEEQPENAKTRLVNF